MTDKLFDSFIKQKLENFESKVPDNLWQKIMPEEEKKPKVFWWLNKTAITIAIALLIGGATTYVVTNDKKNADSDDKTLIQNKTEQNSFTKRQDAIVTSDDNINNKTLSNNYKLNTVDTKADNVEKSVEQENSLKQQNDFEKNIALSDTKQEKATKNNSTKNHNKLKFNKSKLSNYTKTPTTKKYKLTEQTDFWEQNNFSAKNNSKSVFNPLIFQSSNLAIEENLSKLEKTSNKNIDFKIGNLFGKTEDCPTARGSSRNDFYLEAYASPDYTFKKVISTANGLDQYLTKKDSAEVLRGGFTIGARISKSITENLLLKAGIQYSQINEEFRLKTENERRQTIVINSHTITRPGNSDTTISDTSYYVQIGYRVQTNMNYYKNLEIPILLSYEFGESTSKWKYAINAGAIVNITSWYEGRTLDTNYKMVSINNKSANSFYKQDLGLSLYGGFSILRKISDNVDVFAEPYFRLSLNKIESTNGFNQKFNAVGLQIGTRIKLSKDKHL